MKQKFNGLCVGLTAFLAAALAASGANDAYTAASGAWTNASNWSNGTVPDGPTDNDYAYIGEDGSLSGVTPAAVAASWSNSAYRIYLGESGCHGELDLSQPGDYVWVKGTLTTEDLVVGAGGTGLLVLADGFIRSDDRISVGGSSQSGFTDGTGVVTQEAGVIFCPDQLTIGERGTGTFVQNGGMNRAVNYVRLARYTGGYGKYVLDGGNLWCNSTFGLGRSESSTGTGACTGEVEQTGGRIQCGTLLMGYGDANGSGVVGNYTMDGGSLAVHNYQYLGNYGQANFTQNGGTVAFTMEGSTYYTLMGQQAGSVGNYTMTDGYLGLYAANASYGSLSMARNGQATFTQSGGIVDSRSAIYMAGAAGGDATSLATYTLTGADTKLRSRETIRVGYRGTGTFTHVDGRVDALGHLYVGSESSGHGTYTIDGTGAVLNVGYELAAGYSGQGTFVQSNGDVNVGEYLYVGASTDSSGTYDWLNGDLAVGYGLAVANGTDSTGAFTQPDGSMLHVGPGFFRVGYSSGSVGSYVMGTNGGSDTKLFARGDTDIGWATGSRGSFTQFNGQAESAGFLVVGRHGDGHYKLYDGALDAAYLYLGEGIGTGTFDHVAGDVYCWGSASVGRGYISPTYYASARGTYDLGDGTLYANGGMDCGNAGSGEMNLADGTRVDCGAGVLNVGYGHNDATVNRSVFTMGTPGGSGTEVLVGDDLRIGYTYDHGRLVQNNGRMQVKDEAWIAGGSGVTGEYVMADGELYLGTDVRLALSGTGIFVQSNGTTRCMGSFLTARDSAGRADVDLLGGHLEIGSGMILGYNATTPNCGYSSVTQAPGTSVRQAGNFYVGYNGPADYALGPNADLEATIGASHVGYDGHSASAITGTFTHAEGAVHQAGDYLSLGFNAEGVGTYTLDGGGLDILERYTVDPDNNYYRLRQAMFVGYKGKGSFIQNSGSVTCRHNIVIGSESTSEGVYDLKDGKLTMRRGAYISTSEDSPTYGFNSGNGYSGIWIARDGKAELNLSTATTTGRIEEIGAGVALRLRENDTYAGYQALLRGHGVVDFSGEIQNSGRVVADGYGSERTLDLSSLRWLRTADVEWSSRLGNVLNETDNDADERTNGWYAVAGGRLDLPDLWLDFDQTGSGTTPLNWGEQSGDTVPDLVNGVRMTWHNVRSGGDLRGALLATNRSEIPSLGAGAKIIGAWEFVPPENADADAVDLTIRYDAELASAQGIGEPGLKLYYSADGATWYDTAAVVDDAANVKTITATNLPAFTTTNYIAVGTNVTASSYSPAAIGAAPSSPAGTANTTFSGGRGIWSDDSDWDNNEPGASFYAYVNSGTCTVEAFEERANYLYLGYNDDDNGTLELTNTYSDLEVNRLYCGYDGTGTIRLTAGRLEIDDISLYLGMNDGAHGTLNVDGGELIVDHYFGVGVTGDGVVNQSGGLVHTYDLYDANQGYRDTYIGGFYSGAQYDGNGTYNMTGGTLLGDGRLIVGVRGTGVFKQVSGKVAYNSHLTLGYYPGSVGRYTMDNDAQLYVGGNEYIGDDTVGTFIQSNGHHAVMGGINLAQESGSTGAFDMHGGELSIFSSLAVGREGPGTFLQDGGFVDVGGILYVPYGYDDNHVAGTYELRGADTRLLVRGDVFYVGASASTTGTFTHVDGRVDVLGELRIANGTDSRGAYSLDGAGAELIRCDVAYVGYGTDSTGTFVQSNGTHLSKVSGGLIVGNGTRSYGRYDYLGGELVLDGSLYVSYGTDSTGVFVHADGLTTRCQDLSVGYNGGGRGTYTMGTNGGSGTRLTALNGLYVGRGEGQQGFFTQNNGSLEAGGPFGIATATSSSGRYDLVAGDLLVHDSGCYVGYGAGAHAAFVQGTNAGWVRIYGANATYSFGLALGLGAGSSGTYDLQGGNLFVEDGIHLGYTDDSTGTFFQADGTYVRCNEMRVGGYADSEGTYTMGTTNGSGTLLRNVGAFHMGENAGNGTFYQNNGTHLMYGSLIMGYQADGAAVSTTRYVMAEPAERLNVREGGLYVGYLADSDAEFVQNGEVLVANANTGGDLFVGYGSGANGRYLQEAGDLKVYDDFNIGYLASSVGAFTQSAGSDITVIGTMHLGYNSPAQGTLTINGDGVTVRESVHVGRAGSGIVTQNTGEIVAFDHIYLGSESAGEGKVVLNGGTLRSKLDLYVGEDGDGTLSQAAGSLVDVGRNLRVGYNGAGTYNLGAGSLQIVSTYGFASDTYGVILGYNSGGEGVLTLDGGTVTEVGNGTLLGVGRVSGAEGSISGWGTIDLTGKLLNNGVVTADGGGTNRDLDLSAFRLAWLETGADRYGNCYNSVDNDPGDSNGWYAVSGGRLLLPTLFITDAAAPWYWGEQGSEGAAGVPDLVNSLKIEFSNLQYGGPLDIALLGDGHTALGNTSGSLVGSWLFQPDSLMEFDSVDVTVRYDEDLAAALEGGEGELKGYSSDGSTWSEVTIDLDTDANTIELTGLGSFGALIAVGQDIQYGSGAPKGSVLFIQ